MGIFKYTKLVDIAPEHKIAAFDRFYKLCLDHAKGHFGYNEMFCHTECDCEAHIAQEVMLECLGKDVYKQLNDHGDYELEPKDYEWE